MISTSSSVILPQILNLSPPHYGRPADILRNFQHNLELARLSNLRLQLLLHATSLSAHTSKFRIEEGRDQSPTCKLCSLDLPEDTQHFISICPALQPIQDMWLPKIYGSISPPPSVISDHALGISWVDKQDLLLRFLADLFAYRALLN